MKSKYINFFSPGMYIKKSFTTIYLAILSVVLISCTGSILMFLTLITQKANPWIMTITIGSYVLFIVFLVTIIAKIIIYYSISKPLNILTDAAKKVASGDFTVRIPPKKNDTKNKDDLSLLIDDFNKMVFELGTIETLKSDFISNISHEIKTPLSIIQNYAFALKKSNLSEDEKAHYITTIVEASKKLSQLVTNILRLNKLDNQEIIIKKEYSLDEQLRCCILSLEEKLDEKNIDIEAELDEVRINTDVDLMEIVWNNLLTNAIKFSNSNGKIIVTIEKKIHTTIVSISDNGCGMDETTIKRMFDRFYQGDTSHSLEGNGLGLSLVKRVLDLSNCKISVTSKEGFGTEFKIYIPA